MKKNKATVLILCLSLYLNFSLSSQDSGELNIGIIPDIPPVSFFNEKGIPDGFLVDLYSKILEEGKYNFRFVAIDYDKIPQKLATGEIDLYGALIKSEERSKIFYFAGESVSGGWGQLFINTNANYDNVRSLYDQKIGMIKGDEIGTNFQIFMKELQIPFTPVEFTTVQELIGSVRSGHVYGGVLYNSYLLGVSGIAVTPTVFSPQPAFPVTGINNPHRDVIDYMTLRLRELKNDKSSYYYALQSKWTISGENEYKRQQYILFTVLFILFSITLFLLINWRILKRTIHKRTRELEQASTVLDNSLEGIMITDEKLKIIRVNEAFEKITGYKSREVVGKDVSYLKKPDQNRDILDSMMETLRKEGKWVGETWDRKKNGEIYPQHKSIVLIKDADGKPLNYSFVFHDLSQNRDLENRIHYITNYDGQTDLPNKSLFVDRLIMAGMNADREKHYLCVVSLGIDNFKKINRSFGHDAGDEVLKKIGQRVKALLRRSDTISRYGGDEYSLLLTDINSREDIVRIIEKIRDEIQRPFLINGRKLYTSCSQGISIYPTDSRDIHEIPRNANQALHMAKKRKKGSYFFYTEEDDKQLKKRHKNEILLRSALEKNEILVFYQPKFQIRENRITGVEALVRWNRNGSEIVYPDEFISILEESGMIITIGEYIMKKACSDLVEMNSQLETPLKLAVNLSGIQFTDPMLSRKILNILSETGFPANLLELEITESIAMNNIDDTLAILHELTSMGISIAVDDFGTGYSSFSYLQKFPLTTLKIDKSFIEQLENKEEDQGIVKTIISLAEIMHLNVIAEGVENLDQIEILKESQCNEAQGYYISKPVDLQKLQKLLKS